MNKPRPDEFIPPPECPVFEPSWEEFADPFAFINKIRPIAEKTGICKVRPPPDWQPPFACDVDRLRFTPRIQRLNELEAQTRVKLNFLDKIAKFWELQGCSLRIPHVERKILDLFQLNKLVDSEGGFDIVCHERHWTKIALKMGFAPGKAVGSHLRAHYERILYPYSLFQTGASLLAPELKAKLKNLMESPDLIPDKSTQTFILDREIKTEEHNPHDVFQSPSIEPTVACPQFHGAKRMRLEAVHLKTEAEELCQNRPNLRRRTGSCVAKPEPGKEIPVQLKQEASGIKEMMNQAAVSQDHGNDPTVDLYVCLVCGSGTDEDRLLLCDGCDDSYHTFCLVPPLQDVPKGDWRCPKCLAQECSKPQEAFGFQQAYREYSLRAFGEMADSFKSDYFNMPVHMVPMELVEKEFWRLVGAIEEDVTVEYGADIASKEFGSGFPVRNGKYKVAPQDEAYLDSGWNLNNMALMDPSVLTHVTANICGMTLPWLYVGMCFSSFCWHIEDHWSYSINYLHWGEPKTWYGAPGCAAEKLEQVMKMLAPELFESQPDLLHQLVTIMNPNTLTAHGVPIYRTNQCAGEFVVTFPRAYHSGFNQGFNFAEAVNFCTVDWMPLGRQCVDHYRLLHRYCVFSHDEMVCKIASKADSLDVVLASAIHKDMAVMIEEEQRLRDELHKMGVVRCEPAEYDLLEDDERQCFHCRTTCFLSAVTCPCSPDILACLYHARDLCSCPPTSYTLHYRFTLDDLYPMLRSVKQRAEPYDDWASHVAELLEVRLDKKRSLAAFHSLIKESEAKGFPDNELLRHLRLVTQEGQRCELMAQQLLKAKRQTRHRPGGGKYQNKLTVEELKSFVRQLYSLPCSVSQAPLLKELLSRAEDIQHQSEKLLEEEFASVAQMQALLDASTELGVALPGIPVLRAQLERARWLEAARNATTRPSRLSLDAIRQLIDRGVGLAQHRAVDRAMARLQGLLSVCEHWEEKAHDLIKARPCRSLESLAAAAQDLESIPAYLPTCVLLQDVVTRATQWLKDTEAFQLREQIPTLGTLSDLVSRGRSIPVQLESLASLESLLSDAEAWKENAAQTFVLADSPYTLLEVLCPRCDGSPGALKRKPKKSKEGSQHNRRKTTSTLEHLSDLERALSESKDYAASMAALEEARLKEVRALSFLRSSNESRLRLGAEGADWQVCVCQGAPAGAMLQCDLCRGLCHSGCVLGPEGRAPWLCPLCRRSQRPPMKRALPLLASLRRLRVRLPEGDALRFLVRRALAWQRRARQLSTAPARGDTPTHSGHPPGADCQVTPVLGTATCLTQEHQSVQAETNFYIERQSIPLKDASPELEELTTEGLLLQLSLSEVQQLCCMLGNRPPAQEDGMVTAGSNCHVLKQSQSQGNTRTQGEEKVSGPAREGADVGQRSVTQHPQLQGSQSVSRDRSKKPKWSRDQSTEEWAGLTSDPEEDVGLCPAEECLQPEGEEVNWVQCDGRCNQWFHQVCVGVTAELAEEEDYVCISCTVKEGHVTQ